MDNKTKILIISPLILIIISVVAADSIHLYGKIFYNLKRELLSGGAQFPELTPSEMAMKQEQAIPPGRELKSPVEFGPAAGAFPPIALEALVPQSDYNEKNVLSLVVVSGNIRMAIIKGVVVKEGDNIDGFKVAKIEPDRVLLTQKDTKKLQGAEQRWIYLEKTK